MKPMKLTDVGTDVSPYLNNPMWVMQQKHDGARMLTVYQMGELFFTNDGVKEIAFSAARLKLPALEAELYDWFGANDISSAVIDGELLIEDGIYLVFDLVLANFNDGRQITGATPLGDRLRLVHGLTDGTLIRLTPTAWTAEEKRVMWDRVNDAGVEGAVSKHVFSLYVPGIRSKEWVKHKLVKTADVVVTSVERTFKANGVVSHGKAELAVPITPEQDPEPWINSRGKRFATSVSTGKEVTDYAPRNLLPVGNASLIGKDLAIDVGSVVEVDYLYWTGDAMIQPRITRLRTDKLPHECDLAQFPEYTRTVVELDSSGRPDLNDGQAVGRIQREAPPVMIHTGDAAVSQLIEGPRSGRGPSGKLRNFEAMGDAKFEKEAAKIEAENNDPEALETIRNERARRASR